jgi:hypothetical protein
LPECARHGARNGGDSIAESKGARGCLVTHVVRGKLGHLAGRSEVAFLTADFALNAEQALAGL